MNFKKIRPFLSLGIVILLLLGSLLRFSNIDKKVYWGDETYTSLWISGYSRQEVQADISYDQKLSFESLDKYHGAVEYRKGLSETLNRLAQEDTQHPPLYYTLAYVWTQLFGSEVSDIRKLSALFGILVIPCGFWLGFELFESFNAALIFTCILAVSPFHMVWSQEARQYNLWILVTIISTSIFLRNLKRPNNYFWLTYSISLLTGLYTHIFMPLVSLVHMSYILSLNSLRSQRREIIKPFLISSILAYSAFLPWAFKIFVNGVDAAGWTARPVPFLNYCKTFVLHIVRVFFDIDFDLGNPISYIGLIIIIIVSSSVLYLILNINKKKNLFILYFCILPLVPFLAADVILGGRRALVSRYLIVSFIGLELMVTSFLTNIPRKKLSLVLTAIVLSLGLFSGYHFTSADTWWNKYTFNEHPLVASRINQYDNPFLIVDSRVNNSSIITMSYYANPDVKLMRISDYKRPLDLDCNEDILLLDLPQEFIQMLRSEGYVIESVFDGQYLDLRKASCNLITKFF